MISGIPVRSRRGGCQYLALPVATEEVQVWEKVVRLGYRLGVVCFLSEVYYPMKVTFRQSGGFAGLRMGCEMDTDSLSSLEAAALQSLVEESGILQAKSGRSPRARDLLNYEITVQTSQGIHSVSFDDLSMPEGVEPLLEYLQDQAQPVSM